MIDYDNIADQYADRALFWKKSNGVEFIPDSEDIERTVDKAVAILYAEPEASEIEIGRLIIRRNDTGSFDVYLHMGDTQ